MSWDDSTRSSCCEQQHTPYSQQPTSLDTTSGSHSSESSTEQRRHRAVSAGHQDVPSSSVAPTIGSSGPARKEEVGGSGTAAAAGYGYGYGYGPGSCSGASTSSAGGSGTGSLGLTERNVRRTSGFYEYERRQRDKAGESGTEWTREAALRARLAEFSSKISGDRK